MNTWLKNNMEIYRSIRGVRVLVDRVAEREMREHSQPMRPLQEQEQEQEQEQDLDSISPIVRAMAAQAHLSKRVRQNSHLNPRPEWSIVNQQVNGVEQSS